MSGGGELDDALTPTGTSEAMDVDTSFLDAYRSGGVEGLAQYRRETQAADPLETSPAVTDELDDFAGRFGASSAQRGGASASAPSSPGSEAGTATAPEPEAFQAVEPEHEATGPVSAHDKQIDEDARRVQALEHTDLQEAVQSAAVRGGDGSIGGGGLPITAFRVADVVSQPTVRALPEAVMMSLRQQLRGAAVREAGASDDEAQVFAKRLSQASLVTAFLLAHLDLGIGVDAATARAAELFRSRDPLLGRVASRLDALITAETARGDQLAQVREDLREVRSTADVLEQVLAYSVADRTEHLARGTAGVGDLDLRHDSVIRLRDRAREATRKQHRVEADRSGRRLK
ncbi:hypothetical protein NE857_21865 [Nocardiopsis exhalans]|uniref:Uncharacterized protein n=1 Tax=Nocardiopsis exhalans TaxID=163604 RepID=A0ABY5D3H1_9ACTN|nr:hypothetical protein [Nocardiopsis exhalans]USY17965.1 hypothetical protein NE857_21865 [Nocardiopsis exhalans]